MQLTPQLKEETSLPSVDQISMRGESLVSLTHSLLVRTN